MALACPSCSTAIQPADVNVQADVAKCAACGEVFRPSAVLANSGGGGISSSTLPPRPNALPSDSRIQVEDLGGVLTMRFPPMGFHVGLIFLAVFAIAWWSFLLAFIGFGFNGWKHMESVPKEVSWGMPCMALFMLPFFLAGLAMVYGVLSPFFGRELVQIDGVECSYRPTLFGIGRAKRAALEDTTVRWVEDGILPTAHDLRRQQAATGMNPAHIMLCLGRVEKPLGRTISRREQEWVFHELAARLGCSQQA